MYRLKKRLIELALSDTVQKKQPQIKEIKYNGEQS